MAMAMGKQVFPGHQMEVLQFHIARLNASVRTDANASIHFWGLYRDLLIKFSPSEAFLRFVPIAVVFATP